MKKMKKKKNDNPLFHTYEMQSWFEEVEFQPLNEEELNIKCWIEDKTEEVVINLFSTITEANYQDTRVDIRVIWDWPEWPIQLKDARKFQAGSLISQEGDIFLIFSLARMTNFGQWEFNYEDAINIIRHEPFHAAQNKWIYEQYGPFVLEKTAEYCYDTRNYPVYEENPFEWGAESYELDQHNIQNIPVVFTPICEYVRGLYKK